MDALHGVGFPTTVCPRNDEQPGAVAGGCVTGYDAAEGPRGYHETVLRLSDGRRLGVPHVGGAPRPPGGVPGAGVGVPVAGWIVGGAFYADEAPYQCGPSPASPSPLPLLRCTLAGAASEYASETEAAEVAAELAGAAMSALRAQLRLDSSDDDDSVIDGGVGGSVDAAAQMLVSGATTPATAARRVLQLSPRARALLASHAAGARALQAFDTMAGNYSAGSRSLLGVRVVFSDQAASQAEPAASYYGMWDSIVSGGVVAGVVAGCLSKGLASCRQS